MDGRTDGFFPLLQPLLSQISGGAKIDLLFLFSISPELLLLLLLLPAS